MFPEAVPPSQLCWPAVLWTTTAYGVTLLFAVRYASWPAVLFAVFMHIISGSGITLGAHRYFSHATFRAPAWFEFYLATIYTLSFDRCGQGLISWAAAHKFHHAHSDQALDPHSPDEGFWHSFCGHHLWRRQDLFDFETYKKLCPELTARPWLVWFDRPSTVYGVQIAFALLVYALGGWLFRGQEAFSTEMATSFLVWGIFVRWTFTQTLHGLVDTINHGAGVFRYLPDTYGTRCRSKNNLLLWIPQFGNETWHNIHHAFPRAANNGMNWYRWDFDSLFMYLTEKVGFLSGCQWISEKDLARRAHHAARKSPTDPKISADSTLASPAIHGVQDYDQSTLL
ncbi:MAG: fatty acid desaturase [Planctomycetaceae bacterium]